VSRSKTEPRKQRKVYITRLPYEAVATPNKASIAHAGKPGTEVDHSLATDTVIGINSDGDDDSLGALENTIFLVLLSTSPLKRCKKPSAEPKKQRATNQLSFDAWKCPETTIWGIGAMDRLTQR
jgi:hypothetical protein